MNPPLKTSLHKTTSPSCFSPYHVRLRCLRGGAEKRWDVLLERGGEDEQEREEEKEEVEEGVRGAGRTRRPLHPQEVTSNTAQPSLQER